MYLFTADLKIGIKKKNMESIASVSGVKRKSVLICVYIKYQKKWKISIWLWSKQLHPLWKQRRKDSRSSRLCSAATSASFSAPNHFCEAFLHLSQYLSACITPGERAHCGHESRTLITSIRSIRSNHFNFVALQNDSARTLWWASSVKPIQPLLLLLIAHQHMVI